MTAINVSTSELAYSHEKRFTESNEDFSKLERLFFKGITNEPSSDHLHLRLMKSCQNATYTTYKYQETDYLDGQDMSLYNNRVIKLRSYFPSYLLLFLMYYVIHYDVLDNLQGQHSQPSSLNIRAV